MSQTFKTSLKYALCVSTLAGALASPMTAEAKFSWLEKFDRGGAMNNPTSVMLNDDKAYVTESGANAYSYDSTNNYSGAAFGSQPSSATPAATGLQFIGKGKVAGNDTTVFFLTDNTNRVFHYTSDATTANPFGSAGNGDDQFNAPKGVVGGEDGKVYIADSDNKRIQKRGFNATEIQLNSAMGVTNIGNSTDFGSGKPVGVAVDGNYVYTTTSDHKVKIFKKGESGGYTLQGDLTINKDATAGANTEGAFNSPNGIKIVAGKDGKKHLLVADRGNNRLQQFVITEGENKNVQKIEFKAQYKGEFDASGNAIAGKTFASLEDLDVNPKTGKVYLVDKAAAGTGKVAVAWNPEFWTEAGTVTLPNDYSLEDKLTLGKDSEEGVNQILATASGKVLTVKGENGEIVLAKGAKLDASTKLEDGGKITSKTIKNATLGGNLELNVTGEKKIAGTIEVAEGKKVVFDTGKTISGKGTLEKTGAGTLEITNAFQAFNKDTNNFIIDIQGGVAEYKGGNFTQSAVLNEGGTLKLSNASNKDVILDKTSLTLNGGTLDVAAVKLANEGLLKVQVDTDLDKPFELTGEAATEADMGVIEVAEGRNLKFVKGITGGATKTAKLTGKGTVKISEDSVGKLLVKAGAYDIGEKKHTGEVTVASGAKVVASGGHFIDKLTLKDNAEVNATEDKSLNLDKGLEVESEKTAKLNGLGTVKIGANSQGNLSVNTGTYDLDTHTHTGNLTIRDKARLHSAGGVVNGGLKLESGAYASVKADKTLEVKGVYEQAVNTHISVPRTAIKTEEGAELKPAIKLSGDSAKNKINGGYAVVNVNDPACEGNDCLVENGKFKLFEGVTEEQAKSFQGITTYKGGYHVSANRVVKDNSLSFEKVAVEKVTSGDKEVDEFYNSVNKIFDSLPANDTTSVIAKLRAINSTGVKLDVRNKNIDQLARTPVDISAATSTTQMGTADAVFSHMGSAMGGVSMSAGFKTVNMMMNEAESEKKTDLPNGLNNMLKLAHKNTGYSKAPKEAGEWNTWIKGFAAHSKQDREGKTAAYTTNGGGAVVGLDHHLDKDVMVGMALGYSSTKVDMKNSDSKARLENTSLSLYSQWKPNDFFVGGALSAARGKLKNSRSIKFTDNNGETAETYTAKGNPRVRDYGVHLNAGYNYKMTDSMLIQPVARLSWMHNATNAYTESNAGNANLSYTKDKTRRVVGSLGVNVAQDFEVENGTLTPTAYFGWHHNRRINQTKAKINFASMPDANSLSPISDKKSRNHLAVGLGLNGEFKGGYSVSFAYQTQQSKNNKSHAVSLRLGKSF